jgi:hypothetical protein
MVGLTMGGESYPWDSAYVISTLCAGAGTIILVVIHQIFFNKYGILDYDLWTRNFGVTTFGCFVEGAIFLSIRPSSRSRPAPSGRPGSTGRTLDSSPSSQQAQWSRLLSATTRATPEISRIPCSLDGESSSSASSC